MNKEFLKPFLHQIMPELYSVLESSPAVLLGTLSPERKQKIMNRATDFVSCVIAHAVNQAVDSLGQEDVPNASRDAVRHWLGLEGSENALDGMRLTWSSLLSQLSISKEEMEENLKTALVNVVTKTVIGIAKIVI